MDGLIREFLIESQEGLDRMEQCLTELDAELLAEVFRSVHTIKGTTGFLGFSRLEALSHAGENLLGLLRDGKLNADGEIIGALLELLDGLRAILQSIEATGGEGETSDDTEMIERLRALAETAQTAPASRAATVTAQKRNAPPAEEPATVHSGAAESTLRVDVGLLNRMMNLVGELVLTRNQILQAHSAEAGFAPPARRMDMVTADLREAVMKARMQPVSHVSPSFRGWCATFRSSSASRSSWSWSARRQSWTRAFSRRSRTRSRIRCETPLTTALRLPKCVRLWARIPRGCSG